MRYQFALNISYNDFMALYRGHAQRVVVRDHLGRTISIPAPRLIPFLTHSGIQGRFELLTDQNSKFRELNQLA